MKIDRVQLKLTHSQKRAKLHALRGKDIFITGGSGTGKSEIVKLIIQELEAAGKNVVVCAPTGMAAIHVGGVTIHHSFGFPTDICINHSKNTFSLMTRAPKPLKSRDVLVVDEVSMVRIDLFDAMMASVAKLEKQLNKHIQIILCGDFFQLPPVIASPEEREILNQFYARDVGKAYAFMGMYWNQRKFFPVILNEIVRQKDADFAMQLNLLRTGDPSCISYLNQSFKESLFKDAIYIYGKNSDVDNINKKEIEQLDGPLYSRETLFEPTSDTNPFTIDSLVNKEFSYPLELKICARVVITANAHGMIDTSTSEYANGTMGIVTDIDVNFSTPFSNGTVSVRTDDSNLLHVPLTRSPIYKYESDLQGQLQKTHVGTYIQYPIRLAYAITIHRSQGQSYDKINVSPETFDCGQLYVALSRARNIEGIRLTRPITPKDIKTDPDVLEFYTLLEKYGTSLGKRGAPVKNTDGSVRSISIWVPKSLEKHVKEEIEKNKPLKLQYYPKYSSERVHLRIPERLREHIETEIKEWKTAAKKSAKNRKS